MSWSGDGALMPYPGKGDRERWPLGPSTPSVVCWAVCFKQLRPLLDLHHSLRDELPSLVCVHCPLKFFLLRKPRLSLRGDSSETPSGFRSLGTRDMISYAGAFQELPGSNDLVTPLSLGDIWDCTPDTFQSPCRWVLS